jgi:hypothetical protein
MSKNVSQFDSKTVFKSPKGEFLWDKSLTPNYRFNPGGVYETQLIVTNPAAADAFLAFFREQYKLAYREKCEEHHRTALEKEVLPFKYDEKKRLILKFKLNASGVSQDGEKWTADRPRLYDAAGQLIKGPPPGLVIGNGSIGYVYYKLRSYYGKTFGVSLRHRGLQVVRLMQYDPASDWGVGDESDGDGTFVCNGTPAAPTSPAVVEGAVDIQEIEETPEQKIEEKSESEITDDDIPF